MSSNTNPAFLDPDQPLSTCSASACSDCPVAETIHCHFTARDLGRFLALTIPCAVVGGIGIASQGWYWLLPWLAIFLGYFGLVEIRVMCSHCPHYAEPTLSSLKCWANYGSPKLWKYRPGPMSPAEKIVFYGGLLLVVGYPLAFLLLGSQWLWLGLFVILLAATARLMHTTMCAHCMNFACPLNRVSEAARQAFLARNPDVAEAWQRIP